MKNGSVTARKPFVFRFDDVEVHEREYSVVKEGVVLPVEPKTFSVLLFLLRNPERLITKEELLDAVWGDAEVTEHSLTRTIAKLRRLLEDDFHEPRYIATVSKVGYRFVCKVEVDEDQTDWPESGAPQNGPGAVSAPHREQPVNTLEPVVDPGRLVNQIPEPETSPTVRTRGFKSLWLVAGLVAAGVAVSIWYSRRPLPMLRVTGYTQITHDGQAKFLAGSDGIRLYFAHNSPVSIAQVAITGGEIAPVPMAVQGLRQLWDVSPDGSSFLIGLAQEKNNNSVLWNVRVLGGSQHRLGEAVGAAYSPDGNSVSYATRDGDIYVVGSDGTGARKLASIGGPVSSFAWSPDGGTIRFGRDRQLWEMSSDGSNLRQLLPGWNVSGGKCCGRWSPDGSFFIFLSGESAAHSKTDLWALDERRRFLRRPSAKPVQLTSSPVDWDAAIPGKDGSALFAVGETSRGELSRFDAQSKEFRPFLKGISAEFVAFSKDGQSVAYVPFPGGSLWKADREGNNPVRLTDVPGYPVNPRWSPDGKQILYVDVSTDGRDVSYVVSSEGGVPQPFLPGDKGDEDDPEWSPDGRKVIVSLGPTRSSKSTLNIIDLASHLVTAIPAASDMWSQRWSPDGRSIAALSFEQPSLMIFDIGTQKWSELLKIAPDASLDFPTWSRDSRFIYFLRLKGDRGVYRVRVKDRRVERVVDLTNWHITGRFGFWMGLDPTDAPLLLRDIGSDDIYALTLEQK